MDIETDSDIGPEPQATKQHKKSDKQNSHRTGRFPTLLLSPSCRHVGSTGPGSNVARGGANQPARLALLLIVGNPAQHPTRGEQGREGFTLET